MVNDTAMDLTFFRTTELSLITAITADQNRSVNSKWRQFTGSNNNNNNNNERL